jgi:hypothetical protein
MIKQSQTLGVTDSPPALRYNDRLKRELTGAYMPVNKPSGTEEEEDCGEELGGSKERRQRNVQKPGQEWGKNGIEVGLMQHTDTLKRVIGF